MAWVRSEVFLTMLVLALCGCSSAAVPPPQTQESFYSLNGTTLRGEKISFDSLRGKVVLLSNVALNCASSLQLMDLQALHTDYQERGLVVLGFPSIDFSKDGPKTAEEIRNACVTKYGVNFPLFQMQPVVGQEKQPVFKFLTGNCGEAMRGEVTFNFEKFLVDKRGSVRFRYGPFTNARSSTLRADIETLLAEEA